MDGLAGRIEHNVNEVSRSVRFWDKCNRSSRIRSILNAHIPNFYTNALPGADLTHCHTVMVGPCPALIIFDSEVEPVRPIKQESTGKGCQVGEIELSIRCRLPNQ